MTYVLRVIALIQAIAVELARRLTPDHPAVAYAWVCFGYRNRHLLIDAAYNVASVRRLGTGRYRVYFERPCSDAQYCWIAFARSMGTATALKVASARSIVDLKTPEFVDLTVTNTRGQRSDSSEINLMVHR